MGEKVVPPTPPLPLTFHFLATVSDYSKCARRPLHPSPWQPSSRHHHALFLFLSPELATPNRRKNDKSTRHGKFFFTSVLSVLLLLLREERRTRHFLQLFKVLRWFGLILTQPRIMFFLHFNYSDIRRTKETLIKMSKSLYWGEIFVLTMILASSPLVFPFSCKVDDGKWENKWSILFSKKVNLVFLLG